MKGDPFSLARLVAMVVKEFIQMRRDRLTFIMMMGVPIAQLLMFGFAINSDPKTLPTAIRDADHGRFGRSLVAAMQASAYYRVVALPDTEAEVDRLLAEGDVQFVVTIPAGFSREVARGTRPTLLLEADATDPAATSNALAALSTLAGTAFDEDLSGALAKRKMSEAPFDLAIHRRYNEEGISQYNIVPGLMGVILTMTMVIMTGMAMTRERERGTMENLLVMPLKPIEVMLGKILPYVLIGYFQVALILLFADLVFDVPMEGSLTLLLASSVLFIAANLAVGFTFSAIAENQLQAVEMGFFYFLPNILLSGFMFPYRGMPGWAQAIGETLPLTHFLRIVRGIMLKGNGIFDIATELGALSVFLVVVSLIALKRYHQTLD